MFRRTETMSVKEFLNRDKQKKKAVDKVATIGRKVALSTTVPLVILIRDVKPTFAETVTGVSPAVPVAVSDAMKSKIVHAFDPLIELIQALSFPIAAIMISGGCLFIMIGNRERGLSLMQNAALGYILVQLSPVMLEILVGIGKTI